MRKKYIIINICVVLLYALMLKYMFHIIFPFMLAIACFFALKPVIDFLESIFHIKRSAIGISLLLIIYITLIFLIIGILALGIFYLLQFIENLPIYYRSMFIPFIEQVTQWLNLEVPFLMTPSNLSFLEDILGNSILYIVSLFSSFFTQIPTFLFSIFIFVISTFFLFLEYEDIKGKIISLCSNDFLLTFLKIKESCINGIKVYLKCQFILIGISFIIIFFAFLIQKTPHTFLFALLTSLLDSLPFIGVGIILIPICIIYLIQGAYLKAFYFFLVYLIINVIRSIMEPKIMNQQLKIPSFILLLSMAIHLFLFGFIGVILSPIHMNLVYCMLDYYK